MSSIDTRGKILEAADGLFAEVGYDAATTREIAARSGVNKALIHYHFENKEALLVCILDRYYERLIATLSESMVSEGTLVERIERLLDAYLDFYSENRNFTRTIQREVAGGKYVEQIWAHMLPLYQIGIDALHDTYPATRSGDLAAEQLLTSFYGMVTSYFTYGDTLRFLTKEDPYSKSELQKRKAHLHRMLEIIEETLRKEDSGPGQGS